MAEIDEIRKEVLKEILEDNLEYVVKNLTPKQIRILDQLRLSDATIAKELHCKAATISQDLNKLYGKFGDNGIINFEGTNKRTTLNETWQEIRKRYQLEIREILERHRSKPISE